MKLNYADRRTDKNIISKKFKIKDSTDNEFAGMISLIEIEELNKNFEAKRPNGTKELVIAKNYKIMTYFPKEEKYCMTVMYDSKWNLIQWYFDIERYECKYDAKIPYSEDLYLDIVVLPDGTFYILDENELKDAFIQDLISKYEYNMAYETMNKIIKMIKEDFAKLNNFTQKSLDYLKN
jgi:hypothetical protein